MSSALVRRLECKTLFDGRKLVASYETLPVASFSGCPRVHVLWPKGLNLERHTKPTGDQNINCYLMTEYWLSKVWKLQWLDTFLMRDCSANQRQKITSVFAKVCMQWDSNCMQIRPEVFHQAPTNGQRNLFLMTARSTFWPARRKQLSFPVQRSSKWLIGKPKHKTMKQDIWQMYALNNSCEGNRQNPQQRENLTSSIWRQFFTFVRS